MACPGCELLRGDILAAIEDINFVLLSHLTDLDQHDIQYLSGAEAILRDPRPSP